MRIDFDFDLNEDKDKKKYELIVQMLSDRYGWNKEYGHNLICGNIPGVTDNKDCMSMVYNMFLQIVQSVANKINKSINIKTLRISVNWVARAMKNGDIIQYGDVREFKSIIVNPQ